MTALSNQLGIELPIIQAPMAGVGTPALAAAVSNAGALGSLGIGAMSVETTRQMIQETKALTNRPFNVNVFCYEPAPSDPTRDAIWLQALAPLFASFGATPPATLKEIYMSFNQNETMLAMLLEEHPAIVSFHFGLPPQNTINALRNAGIILIATATHLEEAQKIADAGLDAVIAQGIEAGGHRGIFNPDAPDEKLSTLVLTRLLVQKINLPVIAAGGIMDGTGIMATLNLGAQAAQLGTAFISCSESAADDAYRAALLGQQAEHTTLTRVISGRPARGLSNRFTEWGSRSDCPPVPNYPFAYDAAKSLQKTAQAAGCFDYDTQWAGQGAVISSHACSTTHQATAPRNAKLTLIFQVLSCFKKTQEYQNSSPRLGPPCLPGPFPADFLWAPRAEPPGPPGLSRGLGGCRGSSPQKRAC